MRGVFVHRALPFGADGVLNLVTDITEQRRLQTELAQYANVTAHDLREPLTTIALFVEQLSRRLERGRDPGNERLLELLRRTHARAKILVDGILEYARLGASVDTREVDMGSLVAEVLESFAAALRDANAEVSFGELPTVRGSPQRLGRVFQNLIANSLKVPLVDTAARDDHGRAHRRTLALQRSRQRHGLRPGLGDDMFVMFKRAHGEEYGGCGIGLAVCRKIVEAHGGDIWAEPAEGAGTVVRFTMPAIDPRAKATAGDLRAYKTG